MVDAYEDWSASRSPSRAKRRLKQGHPQRMLIRYRPKRGAVSLDGGRTLIMHPAIVAEARKLIDSCAL